MQNGLLRSFVLTEGRVVFDPKTEDHHHFIDEENGLIHDIPWDAIDVSKIKKLDGLESRE